MPATAQAVRLRADRSLQRVRERLGMSQERLAQTLGVSGRTVVRLENQEAMPSRLALDRIERLRAVLRLAEQVFPEAAVPSWFQASNPTLGGRAPADVLATRDGLEEVHRLLGRMAWGIPT